MPLRSIRKRRSLYNNESVNLPEIAHLRLQLALDHTHSAQMIASVFAKAQRSREKKKSETRRNDKAEIVLTSVLLVPQRLGKKAFFHQPGIQSVTNTLRRLKR